MARRISPVEVRRGPQRSEFGRLRSGEAHSAPTLAGWGPARPTALRLSPVEVRRGPLLSRAGRWDLARLIAIKGWQMRSGEEKEEGRRRKEKEGEGRRSRAAEIKSSNPHLAGGEKTGPAATLENDRFPMFPIHIFFVAAAKRNCQMFSPEQVHWEFKMDGRSYAAASRVWCFS